ncbi:conserved hypothetical protein [Candidatus Caldarchaeum subterraneum]|uniref:Hypothetical conserved protein n=1 Tax=Caldiarchaeum subterraneum TaxID=311458 RepID=E6N3B3_CALS0|nr:hypothetical conserved protein [Candidatus Caldarchaeum subterraneum]BAJ49906.1 conserved hypothetical protein [Candidatus Caldarchaeum subterraneum]
MGEVLIGAGGWRYFNVPGDRLTKYAKVFDFVEVNSLFYRLLPLDVVASWRKKVPDSFVFTVKCNRKITHIHGLANNRESMKVLEYMLRVCRLLRSPLLVMETPPTLRVTCELLRDFFSSSPSKDVMYALEIRGESDGKALEAMRELGLIHVVDISRQEPSYYHDEITYSRLFGKGVHNIYQFDDDELLEISRKAEASPSKRVMLSFHTVKMYEDAARLKYYHETGKFPQTTGKTGIQSLEKVLREDPFFPASRDDLIAIHGWKIIDLTHDKRIRAAQLLSTLDPTRRYHTVDEVISNIASKTEKT